MHSDSIRGALFLLGALTGVTVLGLSSGALVLPITSLGFPRTRRRDILAQLPKDLASWRVPGDRNKSQDIDELEANIWELLRPNFQHNGLTLFDRSLGGFVVAPGNTYPNQNGYEYALPIRDFESRVAGSISCLKRFFCMNGLKRAARTRDAQDVILRAISIGEEGRGHLEILRKIATGSESLLTNNHTLPMLREVNCDHITIGVFPMVGECLKHSLQDLIWARNSVGDIINILMQALEGLAFIHSRGIVHRDAFLDNFLIQWQPESMRTGTISPSQPRVFLIDFETAHMFDPECPQEQRLLSGIPCGGSLSNVDRYCRQCTPEMETGEPYDPFKVDVWQLATGFSEFKTNIDAIDAVLTEMRSPDPDIRMDADTALSRLQAIVFNFSQKELHFYPEIEDSLLLPI